MENELLRICGVGIICAFGALVLKGMGSQQVFSLRILCAAVVFGVSVALAARILSETAQIIDISAMGEYTLRMTKALGLAMISGFSADICRDCGENTAASGIETVGNLCIVSLCIPLFSELIEYAVRLLEAA